MLRRAWWLATLLAVLALAPPAWADNNGQPADRNFSVRFAANTQGNITLTGNSLMRCYAASDNNCPDSGNVSGANNGFAMTRIRVVNDATIDSSTAYLNVPSSATKVVFAGLYYGGREQSGSGPAQLSPRRTEVKLAVRSGSPPCAAPSNPTYLTPTRPVIVDEAIDVNDVVRQYQGFVEVTEIVDHFRAGCYTVADVLLGTAGRLPVNSDQGGGWALVVAYEDRSEPPRNLTVFDGMKFVTTTGEGGTPVTLPLSGFQTPPLGPVDTRVGFVAYEGDQGNTGDFALLDCKPLGNTANPLPSATGPCAFQGGDFFNSSLSIDNVRLADKSPAWLVPARINQLGFDADIVDAAGFLRNDQTTASIRLQTVGDGYAPGAVTFATELFAPRIESTKAVAPAGAAQAGDRLTYTMSVKNVGLDAAKDAVLTDPLPPGTTFAPGSLLIDGQPAGNRAVYDSVHRQVVFQLGRLPAQAANWQVTVSFAVTVNEGLPQGTTLVNVGTIGYVAETIGTPGQADTPPATTPLRVPDLEIRKSYQGSFAAGDTTTFRLDVRNVGEAATRGTVTVTDTLKPQFTFTGTVNAPGWQCGTVGQKLSCARSDSLAPGAAYPTIEFAARIDPRTEDDELFNTGVVAGGGDGNELNNQSTVSGKLRLPDLAVDKSADYPVVNAGGRASFTIRVANIGQSTARKVVLTDVLPSGLSLLSITTTRGTCAGSAPIVCDLGTLEVGDIVTLHLTTLVGPDQDGSPPLVNKVKVELQERDPNPDNNSDQASVDQIVALVDLVVEKLAAAPTAPAGSDVAFTITVTNKGITRATNVRLVDTLPPGLTVKSAVPTQGTCATGVPITCNLGTLPGGGGAQVVVTAASSTAAAGQTLTNVAEATADQGDADPSDNRDSADVTLTTVPALPSNVDVAKSASPATVLVGEPVTFTIVATNNGPGTAPNVIVTDTPNALMLIVSAEPTQGSCATGAPVRCDLGALAAGRSATVVIRAIPLRPGEIGNGAAALAPSSGDVDDAAVSALAAPASVRIVKRASRSSVHGGETVAFAIRVSNSSRRIARNVRVCDRLPDGLVYAKLGGATLRGREACWTVARLLPRRSRTFDLTARAASVSVRTPVANIATVTGSNFTTRAAHADVRILPGSAAGGGVTG